MNLSSHKWQFTCYLYLNTFRMEHMETPHALSHTIPYQPLAYSSLPLPTHFKICLCNTSDFVALADPGAPPTCAPSIHRQYVPPARTGSCSLALRVWFPLLREILGPPLCVFATSKLSLFLS